MSIFTWLARTNGATLRAAIEKPAWTALPARDMYGMLFGYYLNNAMYETIQRALIVSGEVTEDMRGLRNPAHRAVEFYTAKLWPGMLPNALHIQADNERIIKPIQRIWKWSNFGTTKQRAARWIALFGDLFIKVAERGPDLPPPTPDSETAITVEGEAEQAEPPTDRRVFFQVLDPRTITEFLLDERGNIVYIRLDVMREERKNASVERMYWTEVWSKTDVRIWKHNKGFGVDLDKLGRGNIRDEHNELGFVPIVYAPLKDIGEDRGLGCFTHALDKIDEVNRQATRLHQMLFRYNKPIWALEANMMDASGRPLPAPRLQGQSPLDEDDKITLGDDTLVRLPGMAKLAPLIPQIDYNAALGVLNGQLVELERDLPEIRYYRLTEIAAGQPSGIALRFLLADAIDRITEARGNAYDALARANAIALTMAQTAGIPAYGRVQIGTFDAGDFEHSFLEQPVIALSPMEEAQIMQLHTASGVPVTISAKHVGWSEQEIAEMQGERDVEDKRAAAKVEANARALQAAGPPDQQGGTGANGVSSTTLPKSKGDGQENNGRATPRPVAAAKAPQAQE